MKNNDWMFNKSQDTCKMILGGTENGRSMVEMLGVLAIVGVISIGGIAGYNYGMNKYRTNEILDGANKRAYTIATWRGIGNANLDEFSNDNETAGGTFSGVVQVWDKEIGIQIDGVQKEVCENLIRMKHEKSPLRAITKASDAETDLTSGDCDEGEVNSLYLVFNTDMLGETTSGSRDSSTGSNGGGYCATHTCNLDCDGIPCALSATEMSYNGAEAYCAEQGGTLVKASDLGCDDDCVKLDGYPNAWIVNDIGAFPDDPDNGRLVYLSGLVVPGLSSDTYPALCK
ncbi:MAG: hypothetical protein SPL08_02125 [Pseudomonadota bacterium]|nr:hypothetical protein [Pseudomonadota bacterium]